ncbi:conserved hypothetical protein [Mycoplasma haemofelis str. Langford 1]|uniref:PQ loop repeat family protein n=1 Tax=Mycoplasma haemofelis (strain Langford 1) TaxID=941640 RepID=E8ZJ15_MYCHL|nr:PQ-loop domain-containing transporter [Mycoplasma haemofelis]CBY93136.1 conserved hypothetical protein [Mycoplasma haemofelis str. Langford 1]
MFSLPLLSDSGAQDYVAVVAAILGACSILYAFLPTVIGTYKSKNTVGVNTLMFLLHLGCGLCFFYGALFFFIESLNKSWHLITQASTFMCLNFVTTMGTLYVLLLKDQNRKEAKKYGISELEHYNQYCRAYSDSKSASN